MIINIIVLSQVATANLIIKNLKNGSISYELPNIKLSEEVFENDSIIIYNKMNLMTNQKEYWLVHIQITRNKGSASCNIDSLKDSVARMMYPTPFSFIENIFNNNDSVIAAGKEPSSESLEKYIMQYCPSSDRLCTIQSRLNKNDSEFLMRSIKVNK